MIIDSGVVTGSLQVSGSLNVKGNLTVDGTINGTITGSVTSASYATFAENAGLLNNLVSSSFVGTASFSTFSGSIVTRVENLESWSSSLDAQYATDAQVSASILVLSSSVQVSQAALSSSLSTRTTNLESTASTLTSASASFASNINSITSVYATTGSNTFAGTQYISNNTNATNFVSTAALYTDGGLRVTKDAFISGALSIGGNLTVFGTSSINYVTSSTLLGLEFLNLNTDLPALRYAGINIGDSGSAAGLSSSFWYDSAKDNWLYVYAPNSAAQQTSSLAINGPIAYNNVGNEQGLLGNYVVKSQLITAENNHHITSSQIFDDGTTVAIAGNLQVTGSVRAGNTQLNSLGIGTAASGTTGEIRATADVTAFYSSDERLKEDITPIENPIEKLMAINGVTFNWKEGFDEVHSHKGADTGVIAQQIEAIGLPETVTTRENGFKAVKYEKLNALLIEGFKAHEKEISELKALVNTLLNK